MNKTLKTLMAVCALTGAVHGAQAADTNLRFHQFLPNKAAIPANAIDPWIAKVEKESGGKIKIQHFPSMQLGGKPPELFDQVKDGVVDLAWVVLGYTPGRFPKAEAFELPFMCNAPAWCSQAFQQYMEKNALDEFVDVKLIAVHTHGPGLFHSMDPITKLEDLQGMKVRGGSRVINRMLGQLGAVPVGMPVPQVGEALSKGVISAVTIPWEVVPSLKVQEIVHNHTGFSGDRGLYTQTFAVVMNKTAYEKLPADLKKVIDNNSGIKVAEAFGRVMSDADKVGWALAEKAGNKIVTLDDAETARWKNAAKSTREEWLKDVSSKGINGQKLLDDAEKDINLFSKK